jgi:hypothetical protein
VQEEGGLPFTSGHKIITRKLAEYGLLPTSEFGCFFGSDGFQSMRDQD